MNYYQSVLEKTQIFAKRGGFGVITLQHFPFLVRAVLQKKKFFSNLNQ